MAVGPFVGRADELQQFTTWLADAQDRRPATVVLSGEAGVGKTRLVRRFTELARSSGAHVLSGACIDLGSGALPYAPLIEALRLLHEHGERDIPSVAGPARAELSGLIADFTGSEPAGAPPSRLHVFGAVLRLLDHLGAQDPVVLIFEDLHWADQDTLDLVSYLTRARSSERVLQIGTYRSNDLAPDNPLWTLLAEPEFVRRTERVDLRPFTEPELRDFLARSGRARVDRDLFQRCFELSEGNPFFAEQLIASGALADPAVTRLPGLLNAVMLSRIRRLDDDAVDVMRVAATAGRRVSHRLLATVSDVPERALLRALRECVDRQLLVIDPTDDTYAFGHALLRAAVYHSLLPGERVSLHAAMAEAISAEPGLSVAEDLTAAAELAHHWYAAERWPQALEAAVRAGDAAVRMRAFHEAEKQYTRALKLWPRVRHPQVVAGTRHERILVAAADAARWAGHVTRAVTFIQAAIEESGPQVDAHRAGELYERLGSYQWEAGAIGESVKAHQTATELLAGKPSAAGARALASLATAALRTGRYTEGLRQAELAITMAYQVKARAEEGRAMNTAGLALTMLDQFDKGVELSREALRIAQEVAHLEDLLRAYANLAIVLDHAGQLTEAVDVARQGLELAHRLGLDNTRQSGVLANNAGATLFLLGRWDEAAAILNDSIQDRPAQESRYPRLTLAEVEVARGRFTVAAELLDAVRAGPNTDPRFVQSLYASDAELAMWQGQLTAARSAARRGIAAIDGAENALVLLRLCAVGLWAAADECARLAVAPADRRTGWDAAIAGADELIARVHRTVAARSSREIDALSRLCAAERARAEGADTIAAWQEVAAGWDGLDRPYPAAYARWREAEVAVAAGDRDGAAAAARRVHAVALELGAEPLRAEVEKLARRSRISLGAAPRSGAEPAPPPGERSRSRGSAEVGTPPAPPRAPFGLTKRELTVLEQLCDGRTNREIARKLTIEESTASVHVSNIIAKLQVGNRTEAAAVAHRLHLFDE